jgi:iron complex outermembrane receptor protein
MRPHLLLSTVAALTAATALQAATLTGRVLSAGGDPVPDAVVSLVDLRQEARTDADGRFRFERVPAGELLVEVASPRFGGAVQRVLIGDQGSTEVTFELDQLVHSDRITVTATGVASSLAEVVAPVDVLSGTELMLRRESTLGETLAKQPGVSSTSYGQGSSRPVIRGLGSDRIRILENSLDTGDVSSIGPDHAVSSDPLAAERVEVVRGPGTLLYGANALGGVVNVLDGRVPDRPASRPVTGAVQLEYGTNADRASGAAKLDGGVGHFAWHLDLYGRDQGDYSSPAPRPVDDGHEDGEPGPADGEESATGTVENSSASAEGATVGASFVTERGFLGVAVSGLDSEYGIPGHGHHHGAEDSPPAIAVDEEPGHGDEPEVHTELEQRRVDLHGRLDRPFAGFSALRFSAGWRDYNHQEIEGDEVGTRFENSWSEVRLEGLHDRLLGFAGTVGLHWAEREFAAFGAEAFVQPTDTTRLAAFIFEQSDPDPIGVQFGLRLENQDTTTSDPDLPDRDFDTFSASAGLVMAFSDAWSSTINLTRSERAPTPEELYSDGPHAATFAYEIGDPTLSAELGMGVDFTIRADYGWLEATASAFATQYDNFIYLRDTGVEEDGLAVMRFGQDDAEFYGFELHGHVELIHRPSSHMHVGLTYDQVRANLRSTGEALPRIPPRSALVALVYLSQRWDARLEGRWVDDQPRVADNEDPTPSYTMLDASLGYKIFAGAVLHELLLKGTNLTDEQAYNHVSFLKLQAPIPGRNISLVYRFLF